MGKRGPKPKRESVHTGIRLAKDVREHLEAEAQKAGHSLTREIELRLERSLVPITPEQRSAHLFPGQKTFWFFQRIAMAIALVERQAAKRWWEDRFVFDRMRDAINEALDIVEPAGRGIVPAEIREAQSRLQPKHRTRPQDIGREAMLINLWAIEYAADQEEALLQGQFVSAEPIEQQHDKDARHQLAELFVRSPGALLSTLREKTRG